MIHSHRILFQSKSEVEKHPRLLSEDQGWDDTGALCCDVLWKCSTDINDVWILKTIATIAASAYLQSLLELKLHKEVMVPLDTNSGLLIKDVSN